MKSFRVKNSFRDHPVPELVRDGRGRRAAPAGSRRTLTGNKPHLHTLTPPSPHIRPAQLDTCQISRLRDAPTGDRVLSGIGSGSGGTRPAASRYQENPDPADRTRGRNQRTDEPLATRLAAGRSVKGWSFDQSRQGLETGDDAVSAASDV